VAVEMRLLTVVLVVGADADILLTCASASTILKIRYIRSALLLRFVREIETTATIIPRILRVLEEHRIRIIFGLVDQIIRFALSLNSVLIIDSALARMTSAVIAHYDADTGTTFAVRALVDKIFWSALTRSAAAELTWIETRMIGTTGVAFLGFIISF
jgi:hypothetical protein